MENIVLRMVVETVAIPHLLTISFDSAKACGYMNQASFVPVQTLTIIRTFSVFKGGAELPFFWIP